MNQRQPGSGTPRSRALWRKIRRVVTRSEVSLITDARRSAGENRRHRERVYMVLQALRIPFLLLSGVTYVWWQNWPVSIVLFAISIPLPWIAVMLANAHGEPRDPRSPVVYKPALAREAEYQRHLEAQRRHELEAGDNDDVDDVPDWIDEQPDESTEK